MRCGTTPTRSAAPLGHRPRHPKSLYIGPGYEYWNHMFGAPSQAGSFNPQTFQSTTVPNVGIKRSAAVFVAEAHF